MLKLFPWGGAVGGLGCKLGKSSEWMLGRRAKREAGRGGSQVASAMPSGEEAKAGLEMKDGGGVSAGGP